MPRLQSARLIAPISLAPGAAVSLLYLVFKFNFNYFHKSDKSSTSPRRAYKWSQPGGYCRTEDPSKRKSDFKNCFLDLRKVYKLNKKTSQFAIQTASACHAPRGKVYSLTSAKRAKSSRSLAMARASLSLSSELIFTSTESIRRQMFLNPQNILLITRKGRFKKVLRDLGDANRCVQALDKKKFIGKTLLMTKKFHIDQLKQK